MARVARALAGDDPLGALAVLNARTRFRFTGVFHVDPPLLRNIYLVDRENPRCNVSGAVTPVDSGYCGLACGADASFVTVDATRDPRLRDHPARAAVMSYAGVPIHLESGRPWGALCHFDRRPRLLPATELTLLESVALLLGAWLAGRQGSR